MTLHLHADIGHCRMIAVDGAPTHLVDEPGGHPIVLVHGSQAWAYSWRHQIRPFSAAGYRVVAPDLPGCGYSSLDVPDASVPGLSRFLVSMLDALGIERASFVASSGGGLPVLDLAIRHPGRVGSLVLASTCGVPHRLPWLWRQVTRPIVGETLGLFLSRRLVCSTLREAVYDDSRITDEVVEQYYRPLHQKGAWLAQLRLERAAHPEWVEEHLRDISAPALVVWGEDDPWHPIGMAEEFRRRLQRARVRVIPRCGHLPHEEQPDKFNAVALQFLDERVG